MYSPTIEGKVYQVEVVAPDASTEGNVSQVEIVGGGQVKAMFDAQEALLGLVVQYVGTTDETYNNGYFYKVVALGTTPETYGWQQINVQPGGSGGGAVDSVNGKTGVVVLDAEDVGATTKNVIVLTGESGTLTAEQIVQVLDDTAVLEIVCDGEVFRLSNKDSTLTYRTYICTNCEASENVSFKVIYVQLNSEAVNYGAWTLEEVSASGASVVQISVAGTTTVEGYSVPNPTDEEVTAIYNAVVAGNSVQVVDVNDVYYQVLQADSVDGAINVELLYFGELSLLYTLENDTVTVIGKKIGGGAEIDDNSTALNKVWSASKLNTMIGNVETLLANI